MLNFIRKHKILKEFKLLCNPNSNISIKEISTDTLIEIYIEVMEELYSRDDYNSTQDLQLSFGIIKKILENRGVYNV